MLFIFFCFLTTFSFAQNIKITYGVSVNESYYKGKNEAYEKKSGAAVPPQIYETLKQSWSKFQYINYTLLIDGQTSMFYINKVMEVNFNLMEMAYILAGFSTDRYYSDADNQLKIQQNETYGKKYLITYPYHKLEWVITSEAKTIHGFKTYKAYAVESIKNDSVKFKITAWFAPKISKPFGPGGYGNLPGLILELQRTGKIYRVKKIEKTQEKIEKPVKGTEISKKEFLKMSKKIFEGRY